MDQTKRLKAIEGCLLGIISAVTQTPSKTVQNARTASSIAVAKVAGAATTAGIWGLVSTLGTAGTGTAIGTLSGAASTSATLAWIGGLVGGGMAAGAVILPVTGIAAGAAATLYVRRKLFGRPRKLGELAHFEEEILFAADRLLRPLEALSKKAMVDPSDDELRVFARDGLGTLVSQLENRLAKSKAGSPRAMSEPDFSATLLPKYQEQLRNHCRELKLQMEFLSRPRKKTIWQVFGSFLIKLKGNKIKSKDGQIALHGSVVLFVTFQRLLSDKLSLLTLENDLVLDALRRSTSALGDASIEELAHYVQALSPDQLTGVISNTKGIYHELLFVEMHNSSGSHLNAQVMEATNFPGADVQYFMDGDIVREVQLKAVDSTSSVYEHLSRYPEIEILVTEETAAVLDGIGSSGFKNAVLTKDVTERLTMLHGEGLIGEISDGIVTSLFVNSAFAVWKVLTRGNGQMLDFRPYLVNAGVAVGTATAIDGAVAIAVGS